MNTLWIICVLLATVVTCQAARPWVWGDKIRQSFYGLTGEGTFLDGYVANDGSRRLDSIKGLGGDFVARLLTPAESTNQGLPKDLKARIGDQELFPTESSSPEARRVLLLENETAFQPILFMCDTREDLDWLLDVQEKQALQRKARTSSKREVYLPVAQQKLDEALQKEVYVDGRPVDPICEVLRKLFQAERENKDSRAIYVQKNGTGTVFTNPGVFQFAAEKYEAFDNSPALSMGLTRQPEEARELEDSADEGIDETRKFGRRELGLVACFLMGATGIAMMALAAVRSKAKKRSEKNRDNKERKKPVEKRVVRREAKDEGYEYGYSEGCYSESEEDEV